MKELRDGNKKQRHEKHRIQLFTVMVSLWQNKVFCLEIQHAVAVSVIKNSSHYFPHNLRGEML